MNKILILYPSAFKSYSKFSRKVSNIIANMDNIEFIYVSDPNNFVISYKKDNGNISIREIKEIDIKEVTHSIIFDDGEEFVWERGLFLENNIPMRFINIKITRVINIHKEVEFANLRSTRDYEYIGRGSYWGNPYSMYEEGDSREDVILKFKYDFEKDIFPKKDKSKVYELAGKRLGCFCKPQDCHGDVLADFLNSLDDGL